MACTGSALMASIASIANSLRHEMLKFSYGVKAFASRYKYYANMQVHVVDALGFGSPFGGCLCRNAIDHDSACVFAPKLPYIA